VPIVGFYVQRKHHFGLVTAALSAVLFILGADDRRERQPI
jgi:hypothetical protein